MNLDFVMSVRDINDLEELKGMISNGDKLIIVEFFALWCGPCSIIGPEFERLAAETPTADFIRVDVGNSKDIAAAYDVTSMPTFLFFHDGMKLDHLVGGKVEILEEILNIHLQL